jgi:hypothetical protein
MAGNGGKRAGAGRKPKAEELKIVNAAIDSITQLHGSLEGGFKALLKSGEPALIKFVFEHAVGKPKEKVDVTTNGNDIGGTQEIIFRDYSKPKDAKA